MENNRRSNVAAGVVLIMLGVVFLLFQIPGLRWLPFLSWPMIVVTVGVGLFLFGLMVGAPDMAIPGCIVGGVGGILIWQNMTQRWDTWSFAWALIIVSVGLGQVVAGLIKGKMHEVTDGLHTIVTGAILFVIFGAFFGALHLGPYWPLLLIGLGVWLLIRNLIRPIAGER